MFQTACFFITLILLSLISISVSIRKRKLSSESKNGSASAFVVSGAIIGTLVGGSSTVGTAQLAYNYGFSAWWFTLGAGIGCLFLALFFAKPLRKSGAETLTEMISSAYGEKCGKTAAILSSLGLFINVIAQLIAASSLVAAVLHLENASIELLIVIALMSVYALSGDISGFGSVGILKTFLLYVISVGGGLFALHLMGGIEGLVHNDTLEHSQYFTLFSRGVGNDLGAGISVILGTLSTQTYAQACIAAKNDRSAKNGALLGAFLIPPIGVGGILIGLYMRTHYPDLPNARLAFPKFLLDSFPGPLGSVIAAALLFAVVGAGTGIALGVATVIRNDLISGRAKSVPTQVLSIIVLIFAAFLSTGKIGDVILDFSFMSMALRSATLFIPLITVLFSKRRVKRAYVFVSMIVSPLIVLAGNFFIEDFDPLFLGMAASALIIAAGSQWKTDPDLCEKPSEKAA